LPRLFFKGNCIDFLATEIALCYGQGVKGKTMGVNFTRFIRPNAKLIREPLDRGEDPVTSQWAPTRLIAPVVSDYIFNFLDSTFPFCQFHERRD
jgi:hypothetical protein